MPVAVRRALAHQAAALLSVLGLAGCAPLDEAAIARQVSRHPGPLLFTVCHGYGCTLRTAVSLSPEEWASVVDVLATPAGSAAEERRRIAETVGRLETLAGAKSGTAADRAGAPGIMYDRTQLDCIDETANTTTYLTMLAQAGLLRLHRPAAPAQRGSVFTLTLHNTAVIEELATGHRYAVDSWFHANGAAAEVVPLAAWRAGWRPPGA